MNLFEVGLKTDMVPNQAEWLRRLLRFELDDPNSNEIARGANGNYEWKYNPNPFHWSRQFEWPWAFHHSELATATDKWRVLDVGSSCSLPKYLMAANGCDVYALDNDPTTFVKTQSTMDKLKMSRSIHQILADAREIPFPDNWFDRVFCISTLEHINGNRLLAVDEMVRVLKPGGILILTMDIRCQGKLTDDFYLDPQNAFEITERLRVTPREYKAEDVATAFYPPDIMLAVYCIKYTKPSS